MTYEMIDLQWFAAEDEGRTEEPSEYKLEKARKEGRVAKSQELNSALVMLLTVIVLVFLGPSMLKDCAALFRFYFSRCTNTQVNDPNLVKAFFNFFIRLTLPIGIVGIVGGVAGNIIQNRGFIFTTKTIEPNFKKIIPNFAEYFKNTLFSFRGFFNIVKSIGKVAVITAVSYALIKKDVPLLLLEIQNGSIGAAAGYIARMAAQLLITAAVIFLIIAIPDYLVQRRQFIEEMKMTKQEVKEEYKEMEGDPDVKNHLQQEQRRLLQQNVPKAVRESDVVITNPTHFAVALKYDRTVTEQAPQVTAKGEDEMAFTIRRIARENDVPIVENRPLARGLYTDTNVGDIIPEQYIRAIVLVYTHIKYNSKK
ncbi:MAG TPA: flagellar biosynthesis protein FlhB [Treponema sp.]|nr:flagellar biosynthesis protein FlhB [Treponema sp.]